MFRKTLQTTTENNFTSSMSWAQDERMMSEGDPSRQRKHHKSRIDKFRLFRNSKCRIPFDVLMSKGSF